MRFLIDECLHESLVGVAHAAGFEASHVNHLGLSGKPDWELAERISEMNLLSSPTTASISFGFSARWNCTQD
jgi:predicted nuclease of predicted toxin-antitoxin system